MIYGLIYLLKSDLEIVRIIVTHCWHIILSDVALTNVRHKNFVIDQYGSGLAFKLTSDFTYK